MHSLLLIGGRVIDPSQSFDSVADVLIREGKIAAVGAEAVSLAPSSIQRLEARGYIGREPHASDGRRAP